MCALGADSAVDLIRSKAKERRRRRCSFVSLRARGECYYSSSPVQLGLASSLLYCMIWMTKEGESTVFARWVPHRGRARSSYSMDSLDVTNPPKGIFEKWTEVIFFSLQKSVYHLYLLFCYALLVLLIVRTADFATLLIRTYIFY